MQTQQSTPDAPNAAAADTVVRTDGSGAPPPVNIRLTIPLLRWRFYFAVMSGRERRNPARLVEERQRNPLHTTGNMLFVVAGAMMVYLIALGVLLLNASPRPF